MILAGDIGGTKALIGLFDDRDGRPHSMIGRAFATTEYLNLTAVISAFAADERVKGTTVTSACFGIAGPVLGETARLTNVPFTIDASAIARAFDIPRVMLLNDMQAMAHALPWLGESEVQTIQTGEASEVGAIGLIAAGTGLGEVVLQRVGGRLITSPSEGGNADWAARTERDIVLLRSLVQRYGRARNEHVISGPGLLNVHRVTHDGNCVAVDDEDDPGASAAISKAALEGRCGGCVEALDLFVNAYGAEAGNLALRAMTTGGLFVGGGIAPKILPALTDGRFLRAFIDKDPFREMLSRIPIKIVLNAESGLLGAAAAARQA